MQGVEQQRFSWVEAAVAFLKVHKIVISDQLFSADRRCDRVWLSVCIC